MEYYPVIKMNNIITFSDKWMQLENMLSETSKSQKTKGRISSLISG